MSKRKRNVSISSVMTDEEIEKIKKQHLQKRQKKEKHNYDLITMMLINSTFKDILNVTRYIIIIINDEGREDKKYPCEYEETLFSNHQPILLSSSSNGDNEDNEEEKNKISFRLYYNLIYNDAIEFNNYYNSNHRNKNEEDEKNNINLINHKKMLLRLCFLIALIYDPRIRRFIMTRHFIHQYKFKSKTPLRDKTNIFIKEALIEINYFLNNQELFYDGDQINDIIQKCVKLWIIHYIMSKPD